jgi:hypothetical protein
MALTSPGVQVTVIDESNYLPSATNTVPYILLATASNKVQGSGVGVAPGTLEANANKIYLITSQRDLAATYGNPFFYKTTTGTAINGYELNEYGLLAAYSALGLTNQCYVQRVDIDLAELTASLSRPTGDPDSGTYWFDTATTSFGFFEWNATTSAFVRKVPLVLTSLSQVEDAPSTLPLQSIGSIGDYAVNATNFFNPCYYKNSDNNWVLVGSDAWKLSWPTVQGSTAPASLGVGGVLSINGTAFTIPGIPNNTVDNLVTQVNAASIPGIVAENIGGRFTIFADSSATSDGSTADGGIVTIENSVGTPLTDLGITERSYYTPDLQQSPNYTVPRWRLTDTFPRPTGSLWFKTTATNNGANIVVSRWDTTLGDFVTQACPVYASDAAANYALDPSGGGRNIPANATYAQFDALMDMTQTLHLWRRRSTGATNVAGAVQNPVFVSSSAFSISASTSGSNALSVPVTATILGSTPSDFITAVSAAAVPHVSAGITSDGELFLSHSQGGVIIIQDTVGTPLTAAGFDVTARAYPEGGYIISNWASFDYTASATRPFQDPPDGRMWYYSDSTVADIMIKGNTGWQGYRTVTNDVRGYDLTLTNATGPIFSPTEPETQNDEGQSPLVYGDLWIDTSDLENFPVIYRYENVAGSDLWVLINNTDQTTENGCLFADARWAPNGNTDVVSGAYPQITELLVSDYLDLDAPDADLYPSGILLFNTRRSGFNVKEFKSNYFNAQRFPDQTLPQYRNTWLSTSGLRNDGSPYMGRQAQRAMIVQALKAGVDASTAAREEQNQFTLLSCPQYPELVPNLVALNNERSNTGFIVGDTPLRLPPNGAELVAWANNNNGEGLSTNDGLIRSDRYAAAFYPSCQTTDLSGSTVVQPPSHMMIRTIIQNDNVAFPWFAPAGTRRGVIDNAFAIGYIQADTGEFIQIGVNQGIRDVLYQNNVNPITFVPGIGITNFGNKTTFGENTAMNRINVSRLVAFMRARLETIGKQYLFEPNDQITRNDIKLQIENLCIDLVAKRGIYDYYVQCDSQNNTPARIDANELWVDIAIEPVKAAEFIYIPLRLKNTGEIAAGNVASSQAI